MSDAPSDNVIPIHDAKPMWMDSFVNLLAGLGVPGRDKFSAQSYSYVPMTILELDIAYRSDWIARKVVQIPAWDMTREWRGWQADPDQITLLEAAEKKLLVQSKLQQALIKSRLYGGALIVIGVDAGMPEEELDLDMVTQDSLKFLHVVSRNNVTAGPLIYDISSKYFGEPEYYEARNQPASKSFQQAELPSTSFGSQTNVRLHPSRVVKLIGMETADQMLSNIWGDSVLQPVNDAIKMCGLVTGSLATLMSELKVDIIKIPELKSILSTEAGTRKMIGRFQAANAAKSVVNTIMIDGNEEWQRIQTSFGGIPEVIQTYMQMASGAADIPATRFLGMSPRGLNATGESDIRNYYDRLSAEQSTILTPTMDVLDEVIIRSALGDRPPEVWYKWNSLWQLNETEKTAMALQKAQAYQIDVNAAQIPTVALANARANQLIEDGVYPGLEKALEDAALEGDTIEEHNAAPAPMDPAAAMAMGHAMGSTGQPPLGGGAPPPFGGAPKPFGGGGNVTPFKKPNPFAKGDSAFDDYNECHNEHGEEGGEFCGEGGAGGGSGSGGKETGAKGDPKSSQAHGEKAAKSGSREPDKPHPNNPTKSTESLGGKIKRVAGNIHQGINKAVEAESQFEKNIGGGIKKAAENLFGKGGGGKAEAKKPEAKKPEAKKPEIKKSEPKSAPPPKSETAKPEKGAKLDPEAIKKKTLEKVAAAKQAKAASAARGKGGPGVLATMAAKAAKEAKAKAKEAAKTGKTGKSAKSGGKGGGGGAQKGKQQPQKQQKQQKQPQPKPQKSKPEKSGGGAGGKSSSKQTSKSSGGSGGKSSSASGGKRTSTTGPSQQQQGGGGSSQQTPQQQAAQQKLEQLQQEQPTTMSKAEWEAEKERLRKLLGV